MPSRTPALPSSPSPRFKDALRGLALLGAANLTSACEWLMGGIPHERDELADGALPPEDDDGSVRDAAGSSADAAAHPNAGSDSGPSAPGPDRDSGVKAEPKDAAPGDQPGPTDARDAAPALPRDSGVPLERDAGGPQPTDAGVDSSDAGEEPVPDSGAGCTSPAAWYRDSDRDTYGDDSAGPQLGCRPPDSSDKWASRAGDCDDRNAEVHLEQTNYFDAPYQNSAGADSFDYDCSGEEEGSDGQRATQAEACALLSLGGCEQGSGYLPTPRSGQRVNPWCGSTTAQTCAGLLGLACGTDGPKTVSDPYGCR